MLGKPVTFWYRCSRQFGWLYTLTDGTEVLTFSQVYTPGWHLFTDEVEDLRVLA